MTTGEVWLRLYIGLLSNPHETPRTAALGADMALKEYLDRLPTLLGEKSKIDRQT